MRKGLYILSRFLFGLYIIWIGLKGINDISTKHQFVSKSIEKYETISKELNADFLHPFGYDFPVNFDMLKTNAAELVYFINILMIIGGTFTAFGFSLGRTFIVTSLLLDLLLIHNIFYFAEEKMKVNVLKIISILGGALHIV
jgi:uncharacterized membrane protein